MNNTYVQLALVFSYLSLLGFGGGKGIIPAMITQTVDIHHWVTNVQFSQFYAIGRVVPGPTTIMVALIGYKAAGFTGALVATVATFVPAAVVMTVVSIFWKRLDGSTWKDIIARGLAPVIIGLMWSSVFSLGKGVVDSLAMIVLTASVAVISLRTEISPAALIGASAAVGFGLSFM